jgi:hypothetical protein
MKLKVWFVFGIIAATRLHAWNDTGHKVVGLLAYEHLTKTARANANTLLKAHPHYALLLTNDAPADADLNQWVFLKAATWPDLVRPAFGPNRKPEEITKYHRSSWHYVNRIYVWPADAGQFNASTLPMGGDLLLGIETSRRVLSDKSKPAAERAVHLAWLLHLIGDLHQPLHSSSMFSARTPKGDQGGNLVAVRRGNSVLKLHSYWDEVLGTGTSMKFLNSVAHGITTEYLAGDLRKKLPELATTSPVEWVDESFAAATQHAYVKGALTWRPYADWDKRGELGLKTTDFPVLDTDYLIKSREVARRRAALAAVRLAELLNDLLK